MVLAPLGLVTLVCILRKGIDMLKNGFLATVAIVRLLPLPANFGAALARRRPALGAIATRAHCHSAGSRPHYRATCR